MKKKGKALLDYSDDELELYRKELATAGALSNLFSNNSAPFIQYRMAENIYCHAFKARNISRDDSTADALHGKTGVAIKTFLKSAHNQKIAEFNKEAPLYRNLNVEEKIK